MDPAIERQEGEPSCSLFSHFPPEIRRLMIDKMESASRCRFSVASILSNAEAKASKNFINGLEITIFDENKIHIGVYFLPSENDPRCGYCLQFIRRDDNTKCIRYVPLREVTIGIETVQEEQEQEWEEEVLDEEDLLEKSMNHFRNLTSKHQCFIKSLTIQVIPDQIDVKFGITKLLKLENFTILDKIGFSRLLPQPRLDLKKLIVHGEIPTEMFKQKVYHTSNEVDMTSLQLSYPQFVRLVAPIVFINIGSISENHLFNFVTTWQEKPTTERENYYYFDLQNSVFSRQLFFNLFGQTVDGDNENSLTLSHHTQKHTYAVLESSETFVSILFYQTFAQSAAHQNLRRLLNVSKQKRVGRRQPGLII